MRDPAFFSSTSRSFLEFPEWDSFRAQESAQQLKRLAARESHVHESPSAPMRNRSAFFSSTNPSFLKLPAWDLFPDGKHDRVLMGSRLLLRLRLLLIHVHNLVENPVIITVGTLLDYGCHATVERL